MAKKGKNNCKMQTGSSKRGKRGGLPCVSDSRTEQ